MIDFSKVNNSTNKEIILRNEDFINMIDYSIFATGNILVDENTKLVVEQSFLYLVGHSKEVEQLAFGNTTWKIKILPNIMKVATVTAVMSGLLYSSGVGVGLSSIVLPAVLPLLIDIDTIKLSVKDNYILTEMNKHKSLKSKKLEPRKIYEKLNVEVQNQITFVEFLDILEVLNLTGHVNSYKSGKNFKLNEKKVFKLQIS